jgi:hypothetical protein
MGQTIVEKRASSDMRSPKHTATGKNMSVDAFGERHDVVYRQMSEDQTRTGVVELLR